MIRLLLLLVTPSLPVQPFTAPPGRAEQQAPSVEQAPAPPPAAAEPAQTEATPEDEIIEVIAKDDEAATPEPGEEVLIGREPTEAAWRGVRNRMQTRFNALREGVRLPYDAWNFTTAIEDWKSDIDLYAEFAVALATDDHEEIEREIEVIDLLTHYLALDYSSGNPIRIESTLRQIDSRLQNMESMSARADARAGRSDRWGYTLFPPDWGEPRVRDKMFGDGLVFYSAAELLEMARDRQYTLSRTQQDRLELDSEVLAKETLEIARALATRHAELPELSRAGFRNVAMRMEVVAENIIDFGRKRDRIGINRQVFLLGESVRDMQRFLDLREAPAP